MSFPSSSFSFGGRCEAAEEKKRRRMISNRESARRSRMKKKKLVEELVKEQGLLRRTISEHRTVYSEVESRRSLLDSENQVLMAEKLRLTRYLNALKFILAGRVQMVALEPLLETSSDAALALPITATSGIFGF